MTATLVYEETRSLDPDIKRILDAALAPIGVEVVGVRGDHVLVLRVIDKSLAPKQFREALRERLESESAQAVWSHFNGAVYS
jgi:regulator of protease activity HflC (stomatin/prohibitin superfamily)